MHFQAVCSVHVLGDINQNYTRAASFNSGCPHFNQFIDTGDSNQHVEGSGNYVFQV